MTQETQPVIIIYTEVERKIDLYYQMQKITTRHELAVSPHAVTSTKADFTLNQVMDVSYKPFSSEAGILYLHTTKGVYPYNIHSHPQEFINAFRSYK